MPAITTTNGSQWTILDRLSTKQVIDEDDISAVANALRQHRITNGVIVERFEDVVAKMVGYKHGVACSSGTAALHLATASLGLSGAVAVPTLTFKATSRAVSYVGATPTVVDVNPLTGLIDRWKIPANVEAVIAVDYAGQRVNYGELRSLGIPVIADASHSFGVARNECAVTCLSFHPEKTITTGEGGMLLTDDREIAERARDLRSHGYWRREGFNYRMTEMAAALGLSQLKKMHNILHRRAEIASLYRSMLPPSVLPLWCVSPHSWHLFPVTADRIPEFEWIGRHYPPLGATANASELWGRLFDLPISPNMLDEDVQWVVDQLS